MSSKAASRKPRPATTTAKCRFTVSPFHIRHETMKRPATNALDQSARECVWNIAVHATADNVGAKERRRQTSYTQAACGPRRCCCGPCTPRTPRPAHWVGFPSWKCVTPDRGRFVVAWAAAGVDRAGRASPGCFGRGRAGGGPFGLRILTRESEIDSSWYLVSPYHPRKKF